MDSKMNVQEISIPVPWGHIAAKHWNADAGAAAGGERVLCLHGFEDNCASFDRLIPLLSRRREYLCVDMPNHGRSSGTPPGARWTLEHYVTTAKRLADHAWPARPLSFTCVGHSMGGQVGILLAAVYPEAVVRLVLLDAAGPLHMYPEDVVPFTRLALDKLLELEDRAAAPPPRCYDRPTALARIKRRFYGTLTDEAARALMTRSYRPGPGGGYVVANDERLKVTYSGLFSAAHYRHVVERVRCPTLWIKAAASDVYYDDAYALFVELYSGNPRFRVVRVPGDHDVHTNHPHSVAPIVDGFLDECGPSKL